MSHTRAVWLFVLALTGIRLTMLGTSDLSFDEAHYWMWSERLAPAYFSKGPGIAFAIRVNRVAAAVIALLKSRKKRLAILRLAELCDLSLADTTNLD